MPDEESGGPYVHRRKLDRLVAVVPLVTIAVFGWTHRIVLDDGYINLRIVDQITAGNGPVFNAGERVEAFTSPMWILALAVLKIVFGWAVDRAWLAVAAGLLSMVLAFWFALAGAAHLQRDPHAGAAGDGEHVRWPIGALLLATLPPMWTYASTGLETGMACLWLGSCFWGLARRTGRSGPAEALPNLERPRWLLVLIGLGPLVRPDFVLFAACFLAALAMTSTRTRRAWATAVTWVLAAPLGYELFRLGYFASLVPNTALAKEAGGVNWGRGWQYLVDFTSAYWMIVPILALLVIVANQTVIVRQADPRRTWIVAAPLVGSALHVLWVVRIGGDYLHTRFFVPALFASMCPAASVRIGRAIRPSLPTSDRKSAAAGRRLGGYTVAASAIVIGAWSLTMLAHHDPLHASVQENSDRYAALGTDIANPIVAGDYELVVQSGVDFSRRQAHGENVLIDGTRTPYVLIPLRDGQGVVAYEGGIGVTSAAAGTDVWVIDRHGLADPLAGRLRETNGLDKPGHEKLLPFDYARARFAPPSATDSIDVAAIRRAQECGELAELYRATNDPLTPVRFGRNVLDAFRFTRLRLPSDPRALETDMCGSAADR